MKLREKFLDIVRDEVAGLSYTEALYYINNDAIPSRDSEMNK